MKHELLLPFALATLIGGLALPTHAAAADNNAWRFDAALNLFLAGMSGEVAAKGIPADVDASFGDILENLEAGAAGRFTLAKDRWLISTEFSYLRLSASVPAASAELEQWLVEPSLGYQFCQGFTAFAGARYNNIAGDVTFTGPAMKIATGTQEWWDPIVGVNLSLPLGKSKFSLDGHFDVGGFGVGSDLTWQAFPYLNWRIMKSASMQLGYRFLGTDYETGAGASKFRYDVILQGPQVGLTAHF